MRFADFKINRLKKRDDSDLRFPATVHYHDSHESRICFLEYENQQILDQVNAKLFVNTHKLGRSLRKGDGTTGTVLNIDSYIVYKEIAKVLVNTYELKEKWQAEISERWHRKDNEEECLVVLKPPSNLICFHCA